MLRGHGRHHAGRQQLLEYDGTNGLLPILISLAVWAVVACVVAWVCYEVRRTIFGQLGDQGVDYNLDRRLRLLTEPEHKSLYTWAITEVDTDGKVIGFDQIPWVWSLYFTANELVLSDQLTVKEDWSGEGTFPQKAEISKRRVIRAKLRPGDSRSDQHYYRRTEFKFFGTDRVIEDFTLDIFPLASEEETETCSAWGVVSYTTSGDFHPGTKPDAVGFYILVKPSTYEHYVRRIADGTADEVILGLSMVSGIYSEWSPDVFTRNVKILANSSEQKVDLPVGLQFEPPRLGSVGEAHLYINASRVHAKPMDDKADEEDDRPAPSPVRPEFAERSVGTDPQTVALLQSLKGSVRWIIGLLIIIALVLLVKG
jgi:hypothetical protein